MNSKRQKQARRQRAYRQIEVQDTLKKMVSEGQVVQVIRPDGQVGYMLNPYYKEGSESDEG
jgi:hypothetical protein